VNFASNLVNLASNPNGF